MAETTETLQMYENMFSNRFTAEDKDYQEHLQKSNDQPPIVENWRNNQRSQERYRDNRQQRNWESRRDWSHSNSYNQSRGGRGWGNNYNQHRQERFYQHEGHHGYNPSNQRFYSDRY